jgi:hypothetical protein
MSRSLRTFALAMVAFAIALLLSHKLAAGIAAGVVVGVGTYLTWRPRGA